MVELFSWERETNTPPGDFEHALSSAELQTLQNLSEYDLILVELKMRRRSTFSPNPITITPRSATVSARLIEEYIKSNDTHGNFVFIYDYQRTIVSMELIYKQGTIPTFRASLQTDSYCDYEQVIVKFYGVKL